MAGRARVLGTRAPRLVRQGGLLAASGMLAAVIAAGCGPGGHHSAARPRPVPSTSTAPVSTAGPTSSSSSPTTVATSTTTTAPTASGCGSPALSPSLRSMGGAAGTEYYALVLTNTGTRPCTTGGYPGVSLLDAARQPMGLPVTRDPGARQQPLVVAPGQAVSAVVTAQPNLCDSGVDVPRSAYVGVFPPNQTQQLVFPAAVVVCHNTVLTLEAGSAPHQR